MITPHLLLHSFIIFFSSIFIISAALNLDGTTLLSFKHSLLFLPPWNQSDPNPCSWSGVTCDPHNNGPVVALSLPNSHLSGSIPENLPQLQHLRFLDLSNNSISGHLPELITPLQSLQLLNLSHNKISGSVFPTFVDQIPANAVVDFSFNYLTGEIPPVLSRQKTERFAGNLDLCGKPLDKICKVVPSSHSLPPNVSLDGSSAAAAAIAAIPENAGQSVGYSRRKVNSWKITAIVVGNVAALMILVVVLFNAYHFRKMKTNQNPKEEETVKSEESRGCSCFGGGTEDESSSELVIGVGEEEKDKGLVMVDGETELELETLLKASVYILGSRGGGSIVYKAVVVDAGVAFAVRRMAEEECGVVEKMREFEKRVRALAKFRHRNLVKIRGFYWGEQEKLLIYDFISNGNLATAYEKALSFDIRLKIAKGIAKGLSYIHDKKHVHGNMKPNNILLTSEMDPLISDFGLEWLKSGKTNNHAIDKSNRHFSTRATSHEEAMIYNDHHRYYHNHVALPTNSLHGCVTHPHRLLVGCMQSPYQAPESEKTLKSDPYKRDVYSFGIILLELFTGKVFVDTELALWNADSTVVDMETKILKTIDEFTTFNAVHERKDCVLRCLKLGFSCASLASQKRPSMKEALQVLEKISSPS